MERCFDLSRSIDLHKESVSYTKEQAVAGVTGGLIGLHEEVEWKARHFCLWLRMRVRITAFDKPAYFQDTMVKGPFRFFQHDHTFTGQGGSTLMVDRLRFQTPVPVLGVILETVVLRGHLKHLLLTRNQIIKSVAESDQWHKYLSSQNL